jgi:hypothetical protein
MFGSESSMSPPTGAAPARRFLGADGLRRTPHCVGDRRGRVVAHDGDILVSQIAAQDAFEPRPVLQRQLDFNRSDVVTVLHDEREVRPVKSFAAVVLSADARGRDRLARRVLSGAMFSVAEQRCIIEPRFKLSGKRCRGDHVRDEREADPCRRQPIEAGASQTLGRCGQQPAVVVEQSMASDESELDELV